MSECKDGERKEKKKIKIYCIWGLWRERNARQIENGPFFFSYGGESIKVTHRERDAALH